MCVGVVEGMAIGCIYRKNDSRQFLQGMSTEGMKAGSMCRRGVQRLRLQTICA